MSEIFESRRRSEDPHRGSRGGRISAGPGRGRLWCFSQGDTKFSAQNVTELREKVFKAGWLMLCCVVLSTLHSLSESCSMHLSPSQVYLLLFRRSNP